MKILAEPIDALVVFRGKAKPTPVKFKYVDSEGICREIKIDRILCAEETKLAGIRAFVYSCQSIIGSIEKRYELKYIVSECRWELYKM